MTKNGQNMAKIEKIRKMQIIDNKEDKFFYFPMISMPCTGSGYKEKNKRLSQNKLEMASVVSFQIEVIWISLKR